MENNTYKTTLKVIGTIDTNVLQRFMEETDEIIEVYKQYLDETAYIKEEYVQPFERIRIEISSYGGCTDSGSAMLDRIMEMQEMGLHVDTHCNGMAYSMAFILFIVGERRSGGKFSKYMNHSSSASTYGMIDKMKTDIDFYGECDRQFDNLILKQTDMPKERLEMARLKNDWIFYDEAIELMEKAKQGEPLDIIVMPEYCDIPAAQKGKAAYRAAIAKYNVPVMQKAIEMAKRCHSIVFINCAYEFEPGKFRNTTHAIDREGNIVGRYYKAHPAPSEVKTENIITLSIHTLWG